MKSTKLVTVPTYQGSLPELGGIKGPITKPVEIETSSIISMINRGINVYEYNPTNRKTKVRLTRANVLTQNFQKKKESPKLKEKIKKPEDAIQPAVPNVPVTKTISMATDVGASGMQRLMTPDF